MKQSQFHAEAFYMNYISKQEGFFYTSQVKFWLVQVGWVIKSDMSQPIKSWQIVWMDNPVANINLALVTACSSTLNSELGRYILNVHTPWQASWSYTWMKTTLSFELPGVAFVLFWRRWTTSAFAWLACLRPISDRASRKSARLWSQFS